MFSLRGRISKWPQTFVHFRRRDAKLCGLNAIVKSAAEQGIEPPPTLEILQDIVKRSNAQISGSDPELHVGVDTFRADQLALILMAYGDIIKQPLRLGIGKSFDCSPFSRH